MAGTNRRAWLLGAVGLWLLTGVSCGESGDGDAMGARALDGAACTEGSDCVSGVCQDGACVGNGTGAPAGADCTGDGDCASGNCEAGECAAGAGLADGRSCTEDAECASELCEDGVCGGLPDDGGGDGTGGVTGAGGDDGAGDAPGAGGDDGAGDAPNAGGDDGGADGLLPLGADCVVGNDCASGRCENGVCAQGNVTGSTPSTTWVDFEGLPVDWLPLTPGCGPDTASDCNGECEAAGGDPDVSVIRPSATLCFGAREGDLTPEDPAVVIEQVIESLDGQEYVHIRVTFDPSFTDATYGTGAVGWNPNRGHSFRDLTSSDHTELLLTNGDAETVINFKIDLISADAEAASGYSSLGVTGGDGAVLSGDPASVLAATTSLDRNLNGCGYVALDACGGDCTVNSPTTDELYTPNPEAPGWNYLQVYEVWVAMDAFGDSGFGQGYITYTHSSPAKGSDDTLEVLPEPCPPDWETPYCLPGDPSCGGGGTGGSGGEGGGLTGVGGGTTDCPPNSQIYLTTEGEELCTPIPYANYPGMTACPEGWELDTASEGRYCLPVE